MKFLRLRTGPFTIKKVISNHPDYLIVQFDDIDPKTGQQSKRKMKKGGEWPFYLSEILKEKSENLLNEKVIVVTSQSTKEWPTTEWFCDVEPTRLHHIKDGVAQRIISADGNSGTLDSFAINETSLSIIDCSLAHQFFKEEEEYDVFYQTLQRTLHTQLNNPKERYIDERITRVRLVDKKRMKGTKGGFRIVLFQLLSKKLDNINYYVVLKVDRKSLEKSFPEKAAMQQKITEVKKIYDSQDIKYIAEIILKGGDGQDAGPIEQPERIYLNCPYSEKDECKSLGGKWDKDQKKWYIPPGLQKNKFNKWF